MAFVLAFTAYVANANESIVNHGPLVAYTSCIAENSDSNISNSITESFFSVKLIAQNKTS